MFLEFNFLTYRITKKLNYSHITTGEFAIR